MAVIGAMPQFSGGDTNTNLIVYMYRLLAFVVCGSLNSITVAVLCTSGD